MIALPSWVDRREYPFASRMVPLSAGRVHVVDHGEGEVVLFVHGTPTWSFEYRHLIRALSPRYRCVAPDHLGFGLSERPAGFAYTPEAHAGVLAELVDALQLRDFTLVVHDFGGPIGLPLAARARRVVILNSFAWPLDDDPQIGPGARFVRGRIGRWMYRWLNASLRLIMPGAYGDRRKLTPAIHRHYLEVFRDRDARVDVLHALARALLDSRQHYAALEASLRALRIPVQLVWGLKDQAFRPAHLARWRALLPHATVVELAGAGHWPHEEEPERVSAAIAA